MIGRRPSVPELQMAGNGKMALIFSSCFLAIVYKMYYLEPSFKVVLGSWKTGLFLGLVRPVGKGPLEKWSVFMLKSSVFGKVL